MLVEVFPALLPIHEVADDLLDAVWIGDFHATGSPNSDRTELLGSHHRPDARAPGRVIHIAEHAREPDQVLARDPALENADFGVRVFGSDGSLDLGGPLAPQIGAIPDLDPAVLDPEVSRPLRGARDDHRVETRSLQLRSPESADVGLPKAASQRRFRPDGVASASGYGSSREHTGC